MLFLKPPSSFVRPPHPILLPKGHRIHHEVELAVIIGQPGRRIPVDKAMQHVAGYALALDMTARDIQEDAMKKGNPWTVAKGFDTFTPISEFVPASLIKDPHDLELWCKVNQEMRQHGSTAEMTFKIPVLIAHISRIMSLKPGDVILTGTPEGVGQVKNGDHVECGLVQQDQELQRFAFQAQHDRE